MSPSPGPTSHGAASVLVLTMIAGGCSLQKASLPPTSTAADEAIRRRVFDEYKLTYEGNLLTGFRWKRNDGAYGLPQLDPVLAAYPDTNPVRSRVTTRSTTIGVMAMIAGGVAGATFSGGFLVPEGSRWSPTAQTTGYGVAGGLLLITILTTVFWSDPGPELAETYNRALGNTLGAP